MRRQQSTCTRRVKRELADVTETEEPILEPGGFDNIYTSCRMSAMKDEDWMEAPSWGTGCDALLAWRIWQKRNVQNWGKWQPFCPLFNFIYLFKTRLFLFLIEKNFYIDISILIFPPFTFFRTFFSILNKKFILSKKIKLVYGQLLFQSIIQFAFSYHLLTMHRVLRVAELNLKYLTMYVHTYIL